MVEDGMSEDGMVEDGMPEDGTVEQGKPEDGMVEQGKPEDGVVEQGKPEDSIVEQGKPGVGRVGRSELGIGVVQLLTGERGTKEEVVGCPGGLAADAIWLPTQLSRGSYGLYVHLRFGLRSGLEFWSSELQAEPCIERVSLGWLASGQSDLPPVI